MPLYEYECSQCHRRIEKIQKFSDAELTVCPHCAGKLERTITAAAISFKGGGWYKDLYSSTKPAAASGGDAPAASSGDSAPSASSESKGPAADKAPAAPSTPAPAATAPAAAAPKP